MRRTLVSWLRTVLSTPAREFPDFPAALSLAAGLSPDDMRAQLEKRVTAVDAQLRELEKPYPEIPRLFLLESEYMAAVTRAELKWLRGVIADLASKKLTWSDAWLRRAAATLAQLGSGKADEKEAPELSTASRGAGRKRRRGVGKP